MVKIHCPALATHAVGHALRARRFLPPSPPILQYSRISISRTGSRLRLAPFPVQGLFPILVHCCFPLPFLSSWLPYKLSFSCIRVLSVFHPWLAVLSVHFLFSSFPGFLIDTRHSASAPCTRSAR